MHAQTSRILTKISDFARDFDNGNIDAELDIGERISECRQDLLDLREYYSDFPESSQIGKILEDIFNAEQTLNRIAAEAGIPTMDKIVHEMYGRDLSIYDLDD